MLVLVTVCVSSPPIAFDGCGYHCAAPVSYLGRVGEASNPGPAILHQLDDPNFDAISEYEEDEGQPVLMTQHFDLDAGEVAADGEHSVPQEEFIAATKFSGHKPGIIFQKA